MDKNKPDGRIGCSNGLFASPDLKSHSRWIKGIFGNYGNDDSYEMTVNAHDVYVYSVEKYEHASLDESSYGKDHEKFKNSAKEFWDSGMTLTEFQQ